MDTLPKLSLRDRALQSRDAIELLSSKWRVAIIHVLREGPLRTNQLQTAISEVSPKVLTETLRGMERDGLIERNIHSQVPAHVEYSLTEMGVSVLQPLQELCHWAKANSKRRDSSRRTFDALLERNAGDRRTAAPTPEPTTLQ